MSRDEKIQRYHHGNLRNALIQAAAELIEESGSTDFAITDAARRAGVSNAAPYRHFKDRDALLAAVCDLCFYGLWERSLVLQSQYARGSRELIVAIGSGYIRYLSEHSAFYGLMWGDESCALDRAEVQEERASSFQILQEEVALWCEQQGVENRNPTDLAVKLWAIAHGLAVLEFNGHIERFMPGGDVHELLKSSANIFLDGLLRSSAASMP